MVYPLLRKKMKEQKVTIVKLAALLGLSRRGVQLKINGKNPFRLDESIRIQEECFPDIELKELFTRES